MATAQPRVAGAVLAGAVDDLGPYLLRSLALLARRVQVRCHSRLPQPPKSGLIVLGAGRASAPLACAVEEYWADELSELVVARTGYAVPCRKIEIVVAAHLVTV